MKSQSIRTGIQIKILNWTFKISQIDEFLFLTRIRNRDDNYQENKEAIPRTILSIFPE